ncbi:hypothetical protein D3C87_63410 [compost metagenome]
METNWNQLIERYLNNELSAEGKVAFETELAKNSELQKEFELHQLTQELIRRNALRSLVKASGKGFHLKKVLLKTGIALVIAGIVAAAVYVAVTREKGADKDATEQIEKSLLQKLEKELAFENIDPEYFQFTGESDVFLSGSGVLLSLTDQSFLLDGKAYKGEAIVQWQEAQTAADIVKAGLSTLSGDKLLETQGMFSLNAFTPEGKKLQLTEKGVYVQVPVDELKQGMKLFTGVPQKNGGVDWQNPVELERLPKPKDMANMDLFPPHYEPKLNELKWFKEKTKRDSLYLSFEESLDTTMRNTKKYSVAETQGVNSLHEKSGLMGNEVKVTYKIQPLENNEVMIIARVAIKPEYMIYATRTPKGTFSLPTSLYLVKSSNYELSGSVLEPTPIPFLEKDINQTSFTHKGTIEIKQKIKLKNSAPFLLEGEFTYQAFDKSSMIYPYSEAFSIQVNSSEQAKPHIPPSKVLAIWNKKFNGTNLATQDFEDRMKAIHETCDEKVFDVYAKNLNESLWKLDERVMKLGYPQFKRFADQKVGAIRMDDIHQKNLAAFYEKAIETLREKGKKNVEAALKKEREWDRDMQSERNKEVLRKGLRESANLNEEYGFNLRNVHKQLGITAGFQMHGGGTIVNIDKYVWDATVARQSTLITDPVTGKTAQITYEPLKVEVKGSEQYDKLFIYLFSKEINSYQRLDFKEGKLDYNLNGDMNYSAALVGMNEQGYFYHQINKLKAEDLGTISLEGISEKEFDKRINILNEHRTEKAMSLKDELKWLFKEQADYKVQQKRRENATFRAKIRPTIYPCGSMEIPDYSVAIEQ